MTDKPMPVKPKGAKDKQPRKKRTDAPASPLPSTAKDAGRTEHIRINGFVSPEVHARLLATGDLKWPERIEIAVQELIAHEAKDNVQS